MKLKDKFFSIFSKYKEIDNPPYEYEFLLQLEEKEYPRYLKKIFKMMTGSELNLKNPKTFNEKIQWLKLYDNNPLKTQLTDKVLVREWIKNKIGEEYLKPVLWIGKNFDDIPFAELPNQFIIKANHGCKWHYKIRNKEKFIAIKELYAHIKEKFDGWMNQSFFLWAGFELQYKDIKPQILIEELLINDNNANPVEYEIYCFNGKPEFYQKIKYTIPVECCVYNSDYSQSELNFSWEYIKVEEEANENIKKAVELSKKLCAGFKLVRVDWLEHNGQIFFNEMTFTPFSGVCNFKDENWNHKLGKMIRLK